VKPRGRQNVASLPWGTEMGRLVHSDWGRESGGNNKDNKALGIDTGMPSERESCRTSAVKR
jgi:hypothetical protein